MYKGGWENVAVEGLLNRNRLNLDSSYKNKSKPSPEHMILKKKKSSWLQWRKENLNNLKGG